MSENAFKFVAAPMQGYTQSIWRRWHALVFGGVAEYVSPFIRVEKGAVRRRDLLDAAPENNVGIMVTPQVIFRDDAELHILISELAEGGCRRIDLNMGCPFGPQMSRGRGAALLTKPETLERVAAELQRWRGIEFSIKMRSGINDSKEWEGVAGILNSMSLRHISVHPRTACDGYSGEADAEAFDAMTHTLTHRLVYNGDIRSTADIETARNRWPGIVGVMAGRGLLAAPWLSLEWATNQHLNADERSAMLNRMHTGIYNEMRDRLCGDSQLLMKIKPLWDFSEPFIGHKAMKAIRKASSTTRYLQAAEAAIAAVATTDIYKFTKSET